MRIRVVAIGLAALAAGTIVVCGWPDGATDATPVREGTPVRESVTANSFEEELARAESKAMRELELALDRLVDLEMQMASILAAAEKYQSKHKCLPKLADLGEDLAKEDPWGNAYRITAAGSGAIEVRSNGPDGKPDTADDVVKSSGK